MKENETKKESLTESDSPRPGEGEMKTKQRLEEANAYRDLGLYDEAEAGYRSVLETGDDRAARDYAQAKLIHLYVGQRRFEEAVSLGRDLIDQEAFFYGPIGDTMLALNFLGRVREARDVLLLIPKCGHDIVEEAYQMACFASRLGEYDEALVWLATEFQRSREFHAHAFADTDLIPFWSWLDAHTPTLAEAHLLLSTPLAEVCATALDYRAEIWLTADDLAALADRTRQLFKYDYKVGAFVLNPLAVASDPEAASDFKELQKKEFVKTSAIVIGAYGRAVEVVLNAQASYAAAHLEWENHLGARQHILWAASLKPALIAEFMQEPSLEPLLPLLLDLASANAADPSFSQRMGETVDCQSSNLEHAWKRLHETPEALRSNPIFQLRLGGLYQADGDYERALLIWDELRKRWPADAVGFGNAIDCLLKLGRKGDAKAILDEAPASYRRFRLYWNQRAAIEGKPQPPTIKAVPFMGQPDLGGLLLTVDERRQMEALWMTAIAPAAGGGVSHPPIELPITEEALKALIKTLPNRTLALGIVYVEDVYETVFGDGYYSYPQRGFFTFETAKRCAECITQKSAEGQGWIRAEAREVAVVLDASDELRVPSPQGVEEINWEQLKLLDLINGSDSEWLNTLKYCFGPEAKEPTFESAGENL